MTDVESQISEHITRLRVTLLSGRGPGATADEVAEHTRDRPLLRAVPCAVGREEWEAIAALAPARTERIPAPRRPSEGERAQRRASLTGVLMGLVAGTVGSSLLRTLRQARKVRQVGG